MLKKDILRIVLYGVGITSLASLVYLAGPLVQIGGYRPLEMYMVREILILLLVTGAASFGAFHFFRRRKSAAQIEQGIGGEAKEPGDAEVLQDKMKDALATLRTASGGKRDYLYELPWYVLIGPPGSGKTTALVNSGLKFPLARGATPAAVAGVGGTRYCDWWFTDDAVLIDTAGRYTTQDSDAKADQQSWLAFLDLLRKNRPRQPINGVLIAISLEDILTLGQAERTAHANAIRARLLELHNHLKVDFPVYVLFTKADLVAGFMEFFANLNEQERQQVWGATFQTADKTRNMIGDVPMEFDALIERLNDELTDRLQEEPSPNSRVLLFGFSAQMATLKRPIFDFLNQIFEPTRYHANAALRGFYFTSGTQLGTPIDQLIGALAKTFGAEEVAPSAYSGRGKSFFLTDLINKVVIGEAGWVSTNRAAVRRARLLKAAAYSAIALVSVGLATVWWTSYLRNKALIEQTDAAIAEYRTLAEPIARETRINDRDFAKVLAPLHKLRYLPAGYANRNEGTPVLAGFGLSQRERLKSSSENAYRVGIERMFRPRMLYRMEEVLDANRTNPSAIYEALKVYLMLGGLHPPDRELIVSWWTRDWTDNLYPGSANNEGRKALTEHLTAMLELDTGQPLIGLNGPLVEESQKTLARLSVSQRAYELLKSNARGSSALDWVPARRGGPDFPIVFEAVRGETLDNIKIPAFFTYAGFHSLFIDRLGDVAEQVKRDRWVLGAAGEQSAVAAQYDALGPALLDLYTKDFIDTWRGTLEKLQIRPLTADKPRYVALAAASAATSPIKQLLESIRDETALTRERPGSKPQPGGKPAPEAKPAELTPTLLKQQDRAPGANIEAAFKGFHVLVEGDATRRPIDAIIANLAEINQSLTLLATSPSQAAQANAALQNQVASLRANANRMPQPFQNMLTRAAGFFETDVTSASHAQLQRALGDQVVGTCQQIATNRYPFNRGTDREVPLADFGRLFAPNGIMDKFFKEHLAPLTDTSRRDWVWRPEHPLARTLQPGTLREFQRAAQIRDAFFSTGGNMPSISLNVIPPPVSNPDITTKLEINGAAVESKPGSNNPVAVQWPGAGGGRTAVSVSMASFGQPLGPPSILERRGVWSLFRMLDAASPVQQGDRIIASFIVGGQNLRYQFVAGSVQNPFMLDALRQFRCPTGI